MTRPIDANALLKRIDKENQENKISNGFAFFMKSYINDSPTLSTITYPSGLYQCFHCLHQSVIWDADFTFEDFGYDGDGLVHMCHCANCGAEIEYRVPINDGDECDET